MGLGIVSDSDFNSELVNSNPEYSIPKNNSVPKDDSDESSTITTSDVLKLPSVGRTPEVMNVPQSLRKMLGETVVTEGLKSAKQFASQMGGLSQASLSTYARGEVSPGNSNTDLTEHLNNRKGKISKRALNKLNLALSLMDETKLIGCDAKELSSVAKDMAIVSKQMEPSVVDDAKHDPVQFHFYAPVIREEKHYDVVQAKDNY